MPLQFVEPSKADYLVEQQTTLNALIHYKYFFVLLIYEYNFLLSFFDLKTCDNMLKNLSTINAQKRTDAPAKRLNASLR